MSVRSGQAIDVTTFETAYGWVGIAWSAQGLVAVSLPKPSRDAAQSELPAHHGGTAGAKPAVNTQVLARRLSRYYDGEAVHFDEPLDPTIGSAFQKRVWAITRSIPRGEVRTYGQIAGEAGSPAAARAVGQAMARNPWPPIVPCHRVVGSQGQLTGFGGGLAMKRRMLEMEGALDNTGT